MNDVANKKIWKGIKLTDKAIQQIMFLFTNNPEIKGLKLGVKNSGCAGLKYTMKMIKIPDKNDLKFSCLGVNLYVSIDSMKYIDGTEIDYIKDGLNQLFKFNNPKSQHYCGCGESFSIE